jgi:hypothetical protein
MNHYLAKLQQLDRADRPEGSFVSFVGTERGAIANLKALTVGTGSR